MDVTKKIPMPALPLAVSLLPSDPGVDVAVVDTGSSSRAAQLEATDVILLVWQPRLNATVDPALAREAVRRDLELLRRRLALTSAHRVVGVQWLRPSRPMRRLTERAARRLRAGLIVQLSSIGPYERVIDAVARSADAPGPVTGIQVTVTGSTMAFTGTPDEGGVIRLGEANAGTDPRPAGDVLRYLEQHEFAWSPRLLASGVYDHAVAWTLEQRCSGSSHRPLHAATLEEVADAWSTLPSSGGAPTSFARDIDIIASRFPDRASAVRKVRRAVWPQLRELPATFRHGDLWLGNVLVDRRRLCAVVDWDAATQDGVPGADILQLAGSEARRRARAHVGDGVVDRIWQQPVVGAGVARVLRGGGLQPSSTLVDAVAAAWWATEVAGTLRRVPARGSDAVWVERNLDRVLTSGVWG